MAVLKKKRLGDILIQAGALTSSQLKDAIDYQQIEKVRLGTALVALDILSEDTIISTIARQLGIEVVNLDDIQPDFQLLGRVTEQAAKKYSVFPIADDGKVVKLAMVDPLDIFAIDFISLKLNRDVVPAVTRAEQMESAITRHYGVSSSINEAVQSVGGGDNITTMDMGGGGAAPSQADMAPMAALLDTIIRQSVSNRASDIHIEPDEDKVTVRERVDGILFNISIVPKSLQSALIGTIKVTSHMDIAESRVPQDGRFNRDIDGKVIEFRVSSFPTIYGENVVLRILKEDATRSSVEDTGLIGESLKKFMRMLETPFGAMFVTGPTGSGKTSTLYAALKFLNTVDKNIITVEDPVEYRLAGIRQAQVNVKAGLDFAKSMRSILRQDPDVIMVGEIRDSETAEIAIQAAMTGHFVLSTLHTNDAPSAILRLVDLGIEPFMVSSAIVGVVGQRLVRRICPKCKTELSREEIARLFPAIAGNGFKMFKGTGCSDCKKTGYSGRIGIFETILMDDPVRVLVNQKVSSSVLRDYCIKNHGMQTMRLDGLEKMKLGMTTYEEVKRVTGEG